MSFRPEDVESFRVTDLDMDRATGQVVLRYAFDDAVRFEERIDFGRPWSLSPAQEAGFCACLRLLHVACGVSYYKAAAPRRLVVETGGLDAMELGFFRDLYDFGLREFAYRNDLRIPLELEITSTAPPSPANVASAPPSPGLAVPVGGGKDSIVVVEALRDMAPLLVSVNGHAATRRIADISGLDLAVVDRTISPRLLELNGRGALNGHVPVTAIVSLVVVASGYLYGFDTTAMSLEGSSSTATRTMTSTYFDSTPDFAVTGGAIEVNHQWSKSAEFERKLRELLRARVHPQVRYLSVLRDLSDLEIAACFATLKQYHAAFRSCNRAFSMEGDFDGWCGDCPKCRFVFLTLATALERSELVAIFGTDLLDDPAQLEGFHDLLEEDRKPFECVGTRDESVVALGILAAHPGWSRSAVVQRLSPLVSDAASVGVGSPRRHPGEVLETIRRALAVGSPV